MRKEKQRLYTYKMLHIQIIQIQIVAYAIQKDSMVHSVWNT